MGTRFKAVAWLSAMRSMPGRAIPLGSPFSPLCFDTQGLRCGRRLRGDALKLRECLEGLAEPLLLFAVGRPIAGLRVPFGPGRNWPALRWRVRLPSSRRSRRSMAARHGCGCVASAGSTTSSGTSSISSTVSAFGSPRAAIASGSVGRITTRSLVAAITRTSFGAAAAESRDCR